MKIGRSCFYGCRSGAAICSASRSARRKIRKPMKTLYILRHGKSDWNASYGRDHERPVAPRGRRAARRVGRLLEAQGWPDHVLSSSAVRARNTAEIALKQASQPPTLEICPELYGAGPEEVLHTLAEKAQGNSTLTAGHEPTCSGLVRLLTGATCRFPTAALARIDLPIDDWSDAPQLAETSRAWCTLRYLIPPRALPELGGGDG